MDCIFLPVNALAIKYNNMFKTFHMHMIHISFLEMSSQQNKAVFLFSKASATHAVSLQFSGTFPARGHV